MSLDDDVARLARTRPFSLLPREAVQLVAFSSEKRRFRAGDALFHVGDPGDAGFFLHSGIVVLIKKDAPFDGARRVVAGALIGETALYAPVVRRHEARVAEDAFITRVPRETFRRVLSEFPEFGGEDPQGAGGADALPDRRAGGGSQEVVLRPAPPPARPVNAATTGGLAGLRAPTLADIDTLADAAFAALPPSFRGLCEGLVIQVVDFPDDETLDEMGAETEFDLLGLFRGRGLAHRGAIEETGELPNMIWLYRRPLLDFWCDGEDTLAEVVTHVLVHEIGHHFGLSDEDMQAIERSGR